MLHLLRVVLSFPPFPFLFAASTKNVGLGLEFEPDIEEPHWLVSLIPGQGQSKPRDRDTDRERWGSVCMKGIFDQAVVVFDELASTKKKKKKKRTRGAFLFFFLTFKWPEQGWVLKRKQENKCTSILHKVHKGGKKTKPSIPPVWTRQILPGPKQTHEHTYFQTRSCHICSILTTFMQKEVFAQKRNKKERRKKKLLGIISIGWITWKLEPSQTKPAKSNQASQAKPSQPVVSAFLYCRFVAMHTITCLVYHVSCIPCPVSCVLCPVSCIDVSKCRAETVTFSSENKKKQQRATWHAYTQHTRSYTRVSFIFQIGSRPPSCLLESLCSSRDVSSFAS